MYLLIFNTLKPNTKLEYWLRTIDVRAKNSVVFLVGTHSDDKRLTSSQTENIINNLKEKFCTEFKNIVGIHIVSCTTMKGIRYLFLAFFLLFAHNNPKIIKSEEN